MTALPLKWVFFGLLILLQTLVGVLYKLSQTRNKYVYSTMSAMTISEFGKLAISSTLLVLAHQDQPVSDVAAALYKACSWHDFKKLLLLALMYFCNNQLAFHLFLWADPASINLLKAGSSLITALIWCLFMGRMITLRQLGAISLQVAGLIVVQIDACAQKPLLEPFAYGAIFISVLITALSSVWNEQQLKTLPLSLHQQNIVLYCCGTILNLLGHVYMRQTDASYPGFFQGYTLVTVMIVAVNACFGVVVTAVYKYADAVLKTLASACTTVVLLLLSFQFFGLRINLIRVCGCLVVLIAVAQYATCDVDETTIIPWRTRRLIIVVMCVVFFAAGFVLFGLAGKIERFYSWQGKPLRLHGKVP